MHGNTQGFGKMRICGYTHQVEASPWGGGAQPQRIISRRTIKDPLANCLSSIVDEDQF